MCVSQVTFKLYDFQAVRLYDLLRRDFWSIRRARYLSRSVFLWASARILYIGDTDDREILLVCVPGVFCVEWQWVVLEWVWV